MKVALLLSVGRLGLRGRRRRANLDARAAEIGLRASLDITGIYCGLEAEQDLALYAGMGIGRILTIPMPDDTNPLPTLAHVISTQGFDLVLAGARSEQNCASGLLPYSLAMKLGWPVLAELSNIAFDQSMILGEQKLGRGWLRQLKTELPAVATIGELGPAPRQISYGASQRWQPRILPIVSDHESRPKARKLREAPPPVKAVNMALDFANSDPTPQGARLGLTGIEPSVTWLLDELDRTGLLPRKTADEPTNKGTAP